MTDIVDFEIAEAPRTRRITAHGLEAWKEEAWELSRLALPLVFTQVAQMIVMTTDVVMLGRYSVTALASAMLGNNVFFFTWLIGCGPTAAVAPMIAHTLGAQPNNRAGVRAAVRMGMWSIFLLVPFLMVFLFFAKDLLIFLGQDPKLAAGAGVFVRPLAFGLPFSLGYQVLRNFSTALKRPQAAMWVMVATIFINLAGDYTLIFGHFGAPKLGLVGAGIASASSYAFGFLALLALVGLTPALNRYRIFRRFHRPHAEKLIEVFRLGMPIGLTMMFEAMLFNASMLLMGRFGTAAVAAHGISLNPPSNTFMVPLGIAMAATIRVGLAVGARDGEAIRRAGYTAMILAVAFMTVCSVVLGVFPRTIAGLYLNPAIPENAAAIALATVFLRVAAAFQIFDALQVVGALSLRGLKDARMPMWIAGFCYWVIGFPTAILLAFGFGLKGLGIWIGLAVALFAAAVAMCWRFHYLAKAR